MTHPPVAPAKAQSHAEPLLSSGALQLCGRRRSPGVAPRPTLQALPFSPQSSLCPTTGFLMPQASSPIGVFDSGVGGLSVRAPAGRHAPRALRVPGRQCQCPYGERGDAFAAARTHAITEFLCQQHHIKALVVACNTATAAAIHEEVRSSHPELPLVAWSRREACFGRDQTGMWVSSAPGGTLTSAKFSKLMASLADQAHFVVQPCDGLAHAIERSVAPARRCP